MLGSLLNYYIMFLGRKVNAVYFDVQIRLDSIFVSLTLHVICIELSSEPFIILLIISLSLKNSY